MKKIAFCISGQIRSYDALKLLNKEINRIKDNFETRVFLSTWKKKGLKTYGALRPHQKVRIFDGQLFPYLPDSWMDEKDPSKFWAYIPKNLERINNLANEDSSILSKEKILEIINADYIDLEDENIDLEFEDWHRCRKYEPNTKKMYYKAWKCNRLKKYYESQNGSFDFVISCRPDISLTLKPDIVNLELKDNEAFFQLPNNIYLLDDMITLANSKTADLLSSIFSRTIESPNNWSGTHHESYNFCKSRNIKIRSVSDFIAMSKQPITDSGELISFRDLTLDYPELEEAYNDSSKISTLPKSLKKIALGFHELIALDNQKQN